MELRSAHYVSNTSDQSVPFKVGDVVLIFEDKQPKHTWKMGRINEIFLGRDGKIRSCAVKLPSGSVFRRPVQLLYPLEVDERQVHRAGVCCGYIKLYTNIVVAAAHTWTGGH